MALSNKSYVPSGTRELRMYAGSNSDHSLYNLSFARRENIVKLRSSEKVIGSMDYRSGKTEQMLGLGNQSNRGKRLGVINGVHAVEIMEG